jgi:hypothetical protein
MPSFVVIVPIIPSIFFANDSMRLVSEIVWSRSFVNFQYKMDLP